MFTDEAVEQAAKDAAATPFQPLAIHDAESDCLEFFASNDSCYAESIDLFVTVYCSQATNTLVGFRLKKIKEFFGEFVRKSPGLKMEIEDHRIKVEHLFTAKIWTWEDPNDVRLTAYRRLREFAKANNVAIDVDELAELAA